MSERTKAECTCGKHVLYSKKSHCVPECPCRRCYDSRHKAVYRAQGRASEHACVACGEQAKDWAQIHGTDGTDPLNYQTMCLKCHRDYDGWGAVMGEHKKRYWQTVPVDQRNKAPETRTKNSEANKRRWAAMSAEDRTALAKKIGDAQRGKSKRKAA